jgi:hypothetical protein
MRSCSGCLIEPFADRPFARCQPTEGEAIAAEWDAALLEEAGDRVALISKDVHPSVAAAAGAEAKATTLGQCLDVFSREELLDEPGFCGKCSRVKVRGSRTEVVRDAETGAVTGTRTVATEEDDIIMRRKSKRIELWRTPPVLLMQLKRFHNTASVRRKLHNLVTFPLTGLSLAPYMARAQSPHPPPDLTAWQWLGGRLAARDAAGSGAAGAGASTASAAAASAAPRSALPAPSARRPSLGGGAPRYRTLSSGPQEALFDGLPCLVSRTRTDYDLYGAVAHEGMMGAGHYTAFARSPYDGHWHCYNDRIVSDLGASAEEVEGEVVTPAAYLLFYVRRDVSEGWQAALRAEDAALGRTVAPDPTAHAGAPGAAPLGARAGRGSDGRSAGPPHVPRAPLEPWDLFPHRPGSLVSPDLPRLRASMVASNVTAESLGLLDTLLDKCSLM